MFLNLFDKDKKVLKEAEKFANEVDALSEEYSKMSDEELKSKTSYFKNELAKGKALNDIEKEAFATVREASKRVRNEYPYKVQIEAAYVLNNGDIAEQKTGEGKTLTSVMPVYLNALQGKGVHVITVNEYLAERDSVAMGKIHEFLGLTVGLNKQGLTPQQKQQAYNCDITYTTSSELGFDYLRDNMVVNKENRVLRGLNFALVDEADSILIDDARTPLIISGAVKQTANLYINADKFVKTLTNEDYEIDLKGKNISLTRQGIAKAEKFYKLDNLYDYKNSDLVHYIHQALKANYIFHNDVDYMVDEGVVYIIDPNTGRKMIGREYSDGLHQAIQAKENVPIKQETITQATITYQNFFRLYNKLAGMTGTAKTEEEEFLSIYNMRVIQIPTNEPVIREDKTDLVFGTKKAKFNALVNEVEELHKKGQPVLVGTVAVETSERISKMLKDKRIRHEVLNAKNHAREADIIAKAGQKGAVTIATNMAGRGTDIKLGEGVKELGGLAVLGSERHESRRIDNQLRGRSGRQGDPGFSRFYVALDDDLMLRFGNEQQRNLFENLGDMAIENKLVTKSIESAQKRVEGINFDVRKTLLDYDSVLSEQRETMYKQRDFILENDDIHSMIKQMFERTVYEIIDNNSQNKKIDYENIKKELSALGINLPINTGLNTEELKKELTQKSFEEYEKKYKVIENAAVPIEKTVVLRIIDRAWMNHLDEMTKLRDGIGLRGYGQENPLQSYKAEGYELFENMMNSISYEVVKILNNLEITIRKEN